MGTRGTFGVVAGGEEKFGYNQYDSYPDGHGVENLRWLRGVVEAGTEDAVRQQAIDAVLVDESAQPTEQDIQKLASVTDLRVSEQSTDDWYCLTRETHGSIEKMLDCGFILDMRDFGFDSLFCEWGYVVDFDRRQFEVYKGYHKGKATKGRWLDGEVDSNNGYGPIQLAALYSFDDLPTDANFLFDTVEGLSGGA
jgi:hypothetical protein